MDLLLLAAVQSHPAHGYAIAETLRARSDGAFDLPEGTLYPALHRLERAGLLSSRWSEVNGRRRRVYQLTAKGRRALATCATDSGTRGGRYLAAFGGGARMIWTIAQAADGSISLDGTGAP